MNAFQSLVVQATKGLPTYNVACEYGETKATVTNIHTGNKTVIYAAKGMDIPMSVHCITPNNGDKHWYDGAPETPALVAKFFAGIKAGEWEGYSLWTAFDNSNK